MLKSSLSLDHYLARVEPDADVELDAVSLAHALSEGMHRVADGEGGEAGPLGMIFMRDRRRTAPSPPIRDRHNPEMAHRSGADERGGLANAQPGPHGRASDRAAPARPASRSGRTGYRARPPSAVTPRSAR